MAGFRKAKSEQAAIKLGIYGKAGSGKTFTSLLIAEGLAKHCGKRVAVVDTENGTHFYSMPVKERKVHPGAFDFDCMYTRSIHEVVRECAKLDAKQYGVLVLDSMTHLWAACIESYEGRKTRAGTIPMHAWGAIKKPYKDLINWMLSSPLHVIICGRQGNEYAEDPNKDGELSMVGYKFKAEGETGYEPHVLMRMEPVRKAHGEPIITAYVEKDRSGVLAGSAIAWPGFENVAKPLLGLLGSKQASIDSDAAIRDAEATDEQDAAKRKRSTELYDDFMGKFLLAKTPDAVEKVSKEITAALKKQMTGEHLTALRERYRERCEQVK